MPSRTEGRANVCRQTWVLPLAVAAAAVLAGSAVLADHGHFSRRRLSRRRDLRAKPPDLRHRSRWWRFEAARQGRAPGAIIFSYNPL